MPAIHPVTMPKFGLSMTEGLVAAWHVEEGTRLNPGDEVADIETTKITNAYESPVGGVLRRKVAAAGTTLPVGALIAVVAEDGVPEEEVEDFIRRFQAEFAEAGPGEEEAGPEPDRIEVGGLTLLHLVRGGGAGLPALFVHGFGGDLNTWMFNLPALGEERAVHALDLPGHGGSVKRIPDPSASGLAALVAAAADVLGLGRFHLVGHSLGGTLALLAAQARPDRVASVTLIGPAGFGPAPDGDFIEGFIRADRRKTLTPVLEKLFAPGTPVGREMVDMVMRYKRLDGVTEALDAIASANFRGDARLPDLNAMLPSLGIPVQVIWGEEDRVLPASDAHTLRGTGIAMHRLSGVGHLPHMEEPAEVNRLIGEFLRDAEGRTSV
jgi:pyruvate dehydrogenase E2 component (dihydrolipoamide acetyltransferase)